jgi:hypothetical protein
MGLAEEQAYRERIGFSRKRGCRTDFTRRDLTEVFMNTRESARIGSARGETVSMNKVTKPNAAYYGLLAERIEALLRDVKASGASPDDDLVRRLNSLLTEARSHLPKEI